MAKERTRKQLVTAGATFAVALGIGFVMQYGDAVAGRWGADSPVSGPQTRLDPETVAIPVAANVAVPTTLEMPSVSLPRFEKVDYAATLDDVDTPAFSAPSASPETLTLAVAEDAPLPEINEPTIDVEMEAALPTCETVLMATPTDLAMVELELNNACRPDAVVAIHHQGMMFNAIADENGALTVMVPALSTEAFFIAAYDDGEGAVAITGVPSLAMYDRAVLQWQGEDDVQLHAFEYGASYGDTGHVWSNAAADPKQAVAGLGGFLTSLGDEAVPNALLAEIYTFPTGIALQDGLVEIGVEAEITSRNCGRQIEAQSIQLVPGDEPTATDLVMTMPDCDAVGEYLVLKNMFQDLTLASK